MAREVIVRTWCDPCLAEDRHTEAEELPPLALTGRKPRVVALCEVHRKELFDPLAQLLADHGQPVDESTSSLRIPKSSPTAKPSTSGSSELKCPGCEYIAPNRSSLQSHARAQHNTTLAELAGEPTPFECDVCHQKFSTNAGRGVHRTRSHPDAAPLG